MPTPVSEGQGRGGRADRQADRPFLPFPTSFSSLFKATPLSSQQPSPLTPSLPPIPPAADLQGLFIRGYALTDIISETARMLGAMKLNQEVRAYLMDKLADIEYRLAFGTSEKLQSASLVAAFEGAKQIMRRHTQAAAAAAAAGGAGAAAAGGAGKA